MYTLNLFWGGFLSLDAIKIKYIYIYFANTFFSLLVVCLYVYLLCLQKGFSNYSITKLFRMPKQHIKGQPVVWQKVSNIIYKCFSQKPRVWEVRNGKYKTHKIHKATTVCTSFFVLKLLELLTYWRKLLVFFLLFYLLLLLFFVVLSLVESRNYWRIFIKLDKYNINNSLGILYLTLKHIQQQTKNNINV